MCVYIRVEAVETKQSNPNDKKDVPMLLSFGNIEPIPVNDLNREETKAETEINAQ